MFICQRGASTAITGESVGRFVAGRETGCCFVLRRTPILIRFFKDSLLKRIVYILQGFSPCSTCCANRLGTMDHGVMHLDELMKLLYPRWYGLVTDYLFISKMRYYLHEEKISDEQKQGIFRFLSRNG